MKISVIIPTLNEEQRIVSCLAKLCAHSVAEVIVVDGKSQDHTFELAQQQQQQFQGRLRVLTSARSRAKQMNAGARACTGEVLWFVHADVELPRDAVAWVHELLKAPACVAGAFKTRTIVDQHSSVQAWWQWHAHYWLRLADLRSRYTRQPYGDQAVFCRRSAFFAVGGFPTLPLMEDLELARRLSLCGEIRTANAEVVVSGRRFLKHPLGDTALVNLFPLLYRSGVSAERLAALYRHIR